MDRSIRTLARLTLATLAVGAVLVAGGFSGVAAQVFDTCNGSLPVGSGKDLRITQACKVDKDGIYKYGNVNIYKGGSLTFQDKAIEFWARSILIENQGTLSAGTPTKPIGTIAGGKLTIVLYGEDQGTVNGKGIVCQYPGTDNKPDGRCGIPKTEWDTNGASKVTLSSNGVTDYFYQYDPLPYDKGTTTDEGTTQQGFFGYKVLAVSYGGTLQLFGKKGATYAANVDPTNSGTSWARLCGECASPTFDTLKRGDSKLVLDRPVDWQKDDEIVITTTDYLPGHSEPRKIKVTPTDGGRTIQLDNDVDFPHNAKRYGLTGVPDRLGLDITTKLRASDAAGTAAAETRAAVALLTRSIRIISGGRDLGNRFPDDSYFGGHTIVRQGAKAFQVQGVEFKQLGQGGRIAHYPIHFHMARVTPEGSHFVKDSSINESMTRWITIHGTQNVHIARNVGWKSIGHGFYLEDGTEINNTFHSNIGIFARAAVDNIQNPRKVPGILASPDKPGQEIVPFHSDYDHPTVFWIMNGWNDWEGNMAAGAGTCGMCYWLVPGANSGHSRHQKWEGYASLQQGLDGNVQGVLARAAISPLKKFRQNYCTSAMNSFVTVGNTAQCNGVGQPENTVRLDPISNSLAPPSCNQFNAKKPPPMDNDFVDNACVLHPDSDAYYPKVNDGGNRQPTLCNQTDCTQTANPPVPICATDNSPNHPAEKTCVPTVLDKYTSSFHWAEYNNAAIWLRPQWYLVTNSVLSDAQSGGLTFITGGGYTKSDVINGHWALARKNVFIGNTQKDNAFASNAGPFVKGGLSCDNPQNVINYCVSRKEGISMSTSPSFALGQRLFNIYDGPSFQEANAYLDITTTEIEDCHPADRNAQANTCEGSKWMYGRILGIPQAAGKCYLPNAAIAWKQPNGFYYPPAFHSRNLYFNNVPIRHFVIEPLFKPGTFVTDPAQVRDRYCTWNDGLFNSFTDVDRQTELNDDDGSLTGYKNTISVNEDPFFDAPIEAFECDSDGTAKTSPYDYVTTVVYPQCVVTGTCGNTAGPEPPPIPTWGSDCTNPGCYGVPLHRQLLTKEEHKFRKANPTLFRNPSIRMMGQNFSQRSTLSVNNGVYYIDTTVSETTQRQPGISNISLFKKDEIYYTFLLFAKATTKQTYQIYVGKGFDNRDGFGYYMVRANVDGRPIQFQPKTPWPWATPSYDANEGVLTVTMDLAQFASAFTDAREDRCRPFSFCKWDGNAPKNKCVCNLKPGDYLFKECSEDDSAVCSWAINDLECPKGGCFGFAVKLSPQFAALEPPAPDPRPQAVCFDDTPALKAIWDVKFVPADNAGIAGKEPHCFNAPKLPRGFCKE